MNTETIEDQLNREHLETFASENALEIPFSVALEVVKREMIATRDAKAKRIAELRAELAKLEGQN